MATGASFFSFTCQKEGYFYQYFRCLGDCHFYCHDHHHCCCPPDTGVLLLKRDLLWGSAESTKRKKTKRFPPTHIQRWPFQPLWPERECFSWRSSVDIKWTFWVRVFSFNSWEREYTFFILPWSRSWAKSFWLLKGLLSLCFQPSQKDIIQKSL